MRCGSPGYAAPEVLAKQVYDFKADVFSCGIILYVLYDFFNDTDRLTGIAPFFAPTIEEIIEKNKQAVIEYPHELWRCVSVEAKELVQLMTRHDPAARISSSMCLENVWLSEGGSTKNVLHSAIENMKKYCTE